MTVLQGFVEDDTMPVVHRTKADEGQVKTGRGNPVVAPSVYQSRTILPDPILLSILLFLLLLLSSLPVLSSFSLF